MRLRVLAIAFAVSLAACVTDAAVEPAADAAAFDVSAPLLPWSVGNRWTYRVNDEGVISTKTTVIEAEEQVGGTGPHSEDMAFRVTTSKEDGTDRTVSWQVLLNDKVLRYREQSFSAATSELSLEEHWDPYKLHIDASAEHTGINASWLEVYSETKLPMAGSASTSEERDRWSVELASASVTVPAGTFEHAIVFTKAGGGDLKTYWYVRGVGKVKETGGQTEALVEYQVAQ